jgi:hypothetical protein
MAVTVLSEGDAAAAMWTDETLAGLKAVLDANLAIILAGTGGEALAAVHVGGRKKDAKFPVAYLLHLSTDDRDAELSGGRELTQRFRLILYIRGDQNDGTLEARISDLADRAKAALHANQNRSADSLWHYLICGRLIVGPAPSDRSNTYLRGAQIDVTVVRMVETA